MQPFFWMMSLIGMVGGFGPNHIIVGSRYVTISRPTTITTTTTTSLGVAVDTSDIKNGMTLELDGEPFKVLSFSIMKQARGAAKTTIKMKNLIRGTTIENTYRSGEKFETALIEKNDHQFTYEDGVSFCNPRCWTILLFGLTSSLNSPRFMGPRFLLYTYLSHFCNSILFSFVFHNCQSI